MARISVVSHPHGKACAVFYDHLGISVGIILMHMIADCPQKHGIHIILPVVLVSNCDKSFSGSCEEWLSRRTIWRISNFLSSSSMNFRADVQSRKGHWKPEEGNSRGIDPERFVLMTVSTSTSYQSSRNMPPSETSLYEWWLWKSVESFASWVMCFRLWLYLALK